MRTGAPFFRLKDGSSGSGKKPCVLDPLFCLQKDLS